MFNQGKVQELEAKVKELETSVINLSYSKEVLTTQNLELEASLAENRNFVMDKCYIHNEKGQIEKYSKFFSRYENELLKSFKKNGKESN